MCHSVPRCTSCHKKSSTGRHRKWCPAVSLPQPNTPSTTSIKTSNHPFQQYLHEDSVAKSASFPVGQKEAHGQGQGQANPAIVNIVNAAYAAASYQRCEKCWRKGWKGHKKWCPTLPQNTPQTAQSAGFTLSKTCCGTPIARCSECRRKSWKGHRRACPLFNAAAAAASPAGGVVLGGNGVPGLSGASDLGRAATGNGNGNGNGGRYPTAETATATATATARSKVEEAMGMRSAMSADANANARGEGQGEAPPAYDFKG